MSGPEVQAASVSFAAIPGWADADHMGALAAFRASCPRFAERDPALPAGPSYAGANGAWRIACDEAERVLAPDAASARLFFERAFVPAMLTRADRRPGLTTAYYEPEFQARRFDYGPFAEPLLAKPDDMTTLEVPADRYGQT
ncbi:MAG: MltA domain-containing protein, partial [Caulobacterales bacterium]|nr:MltA domain-containing protein [Caulobacterales bacterium]